jgi:hypothetical protein
MSEHRNPPMPALEMRAHATAAGECPYCDLMWRGFVASTGEADRLRAVADAAEQWRRSPVRGTKRGAARNRLYAALDALPRTHESGGRDRGTVEFMRTWPSLDEKEAEQERAEQRSRPHEDGGRDR